MQRDRHPHHRLRVLEGPLCGATYVLRDSFVLGRSSVCDLVLLDRRVSRMHARIGQAEDGGHVLYDLASGNGTRVNGQRVRRKPLAPGDEIAIADCCFGYEPIPVLHAATCEKDSMTPGVEALHRRTRPVVDGPNLQADQPYRGDLVDDVVTYRNLAKRLVRSEPLPLRSIERFQELDGRLRDPDDPLGFYEFPLSAHAFIHATGRSDDDRLAVEVVSIGVGGATIRTARPIVAVDDIAHLTLDLYTPGTRGKIGFVGVAIAVTPTLCRLTFSMGSGWSERMASTQNATTIRFAAMRTSPAPGLERRQ